MRLNNPFKIRKTSTLLISIIFSAIVSVDFNTSIYENIYLFLYLSIIFWGLIVIGISDYYSNQISNKIILILISISLIFSAIDLQNNSFTLDNQSLLMHLSGGILGFTVFDGLSSPKTSIRRWRCKTGRVNWNNYRVPNGPHSPVVRINWLCGYRTNQKHIFIYSFRILPSYNHYNLFRNI